ncbi:ribbon-helix-helix protein, CopG family [Cetobacterium sp.]|uniref:ribbon-helix-helix protein, CopG family n=1 Tax=Cetobacterium sp. TaxID=2071632 RepID=UPI003F2BA4C8
MGEKKDKLIQIRITSKDKKKLKEIAKRQRKSMSEIVCNYIEEMIKKDEEKSNYEEKIEKRANKFEEKIKMVKSKMKWY